ncbi:MAG: hypothetical protein ITD37_00685 [Nitrosospira sp.]|nr:hypothetical protein [Nitrosospira sp.]
MSIICHPWKSVFWGTSILISAVAHVIASLRESGRQHPLVIENNAADKPVVCSIFFVGPNRKTTGAAIPPSEVARTFAEIEMAVIVH